MLGRPALTDTERRTRQAPSEIGTLHRHPSKSRCTISALWPDLTKPLQPEARMFMFLRKHSR